MKRKKDNEEIINSMVIGIIAGAISGFILSAIDKSNSYKSEEDLQAELKKALASEDYEKCAVIRDKINALKK